MIDPQFMRELEYRKSKSQPPVETEIKVLLRRKRPNYVKLGIKRSLYLHGVFVALFGFSMILDKFGVRLPTMFIGKKDISAELAKKSIRVDVVDLPTLKLSEMSKVDLTKEAKVVPEKKKVDTSAAKAAAKKDQMILAEKKKAEAKKSDDAKKAAAIAKTKKEQQEAEELKKMQDLQKTLSQGYLKDETLNEVQSGDAGREILAGNIISQGSSITGDIATQRDAYQALAKNHFARFWNAPGWMQASNRFSAKILVRVAPDGRVLSQEFLERSGSSEYDALAAKAVSDASPFPPPPADLVRNAMEDGIVCAFPD
jgi:TonB family protein